MRYAIHKVCAYPVAICWIAGTAAIWFPLTVMFANSGSFAFLLDNWDTIPCLFLAYASTAGLGFFAGAFFLSWLVLPLCRKINGAPYQAGAHVLILSGDHAGKETIIYEITTGQGGQPVPRVDLGPEAKESFRDLYDEYSLLRISPRSGM